MTHFRHYVAFGMMSHWGFCRSALCRSALCRSALCHIRGYVVRHNVAFGPMSFGYVLFGVMSLGLMSFGVMPFCLLSVYRGVLLIRHIFGQLRLQTSEVKEPKDPGGAGAAIKKKCPRLQPTKNRVRLRSRLKTVGSATLDLSYKIVVRGTVQSNKKI